MLSLEKDQIYFQAGVQELPVFILSGELYWPLSSHKCGGGLPRLTIGGLLLSRARLIARSEQKPASVNESEAQLELVRTKWRVAWEQKVAREVRSRLNQWQNFLSDYRHDAYDNADHYPNEVRLRVILQLLLAELPTPPVEHVSLTQLDELLHAVLLPGDFIWDADLVSAFPQGEYWFLYGQLRK